MTKAIEYTKFEQVETRALVSRRPRIEYTPQPMPASAISVAPTAGGASMPGIRSQTRPPIASSQPSHSETLGRSPDHSAIAIIVACTKPNRINAPVPALRLMYA